MNRPSWSSVRTSSLIFFIARVNPIKIKHPCERTNCRRRSTVHIMLERFVVYLIDHRCRHCRSVDLDLVKKRLNPTLKRGRGENVLGSRSRVEGEHLAHIRSESRGRSRCFRARSQRRRFELESDQVDVKVAPSERGRSWREETAREVPASPLKSKQFDNVNV